MTAMWGKRPHPRIAIEGQYLDEVQIRLAKCYPNSTSYLSFPAHRHWARVEGKRVTVYAQAAAVVKLFADGILSAVGGRDVVIEVGGEKIGRCLLEAVESDERNGVDDVIVLHFRRLSEARARGSASLSTWPPPGSGKTTFIEAMLEVVNGPVLTARCIRDDALCQARETATKDHPELWRYKQAGACGAAFFSLRAELRTSIP